MIGKFVGKLRSPPVRTIVEDSTFHSCATRLAEMLPMWNTELVDIIEEAIDTVATILQGTEVPYPLDQIPTLAEIYPGPA